MEEVKVFDDVVPRIIAIMKATFNDSFLAYYDDDPVDIPLANLPCMVVEEVADRITLDATGTDNLQTQLNIALILNKKDDYGASDDFNMSKRKLRRLIKARDPVTGQYMPNTVLGVLRTQITLSNLALNMQVDVRYDLQPRPNQTVTSEARVSIIISERIPVPNRT